MAKFIGFRTKGYATKGEIQARTRAQDISLLLIDEIYNIAYFIVYAIVC